MRLLILGGTVFLGRHVVDAALAAGHDVTLFHRGRHASHRAGDVVELLGDREAGLEALRGWSGDAVIDTSGYVPRVVARTVDALGDVGHYVFVSTVSVYADLSGRVTESTPVHEPPEAGVETVDGDTYGPLKVGCERVVWKRFPGRALLQRAGLLVGPFDPTDRFTYWVRRGAAGGRILAPAVAGQPVQVLDARDLAEWTVRCVQDGVTGVMNATGESGWTFGDVLAKTMENCETPADVVWIDEQQLLAAGVEPWSQLPLWVPGEWEMPGMMDVDSSAAERAGLRRRPLETTIADTLAWDREQDADADFDYGTRSGRATLSAQRERELLAELA